MSQIRVIGTAIPLVVLTLVLGWVLAPGQFRKHGVTASSSECIVLLALAACLVACGESPSAALPSPVQVTVRTRVPVFALPTPMLKTAQPVHTLLSQWLQDTTCTPPCWAGITPGQTPVKEAVEILNYLLSTTHIEFHSLASDTEEAIIWRWSGSERGSGMLGFSEHAVTPFVEWIAVDFAQAYSLYQITDTFGEPSHVATSFVHTNTAHFGAGTSYDVILVYLSRGFYVQAERTYAEPPTIAPGMAWSGQVTFFPPNAGGFDETVRYETGIAVNSTTLLPWQGFQDFATYCQRAHPSSNPDQVCGRKP
jgi:hypothetical protein